jgi:uncharacterized membrane protein YgcG
MSRVLFLARIILFTGFVFFCSPFSVRAEEYIQQFQVQATLDADRRLEVTEKITYDFEQSPRHGIFRNIPLTYIRGQGIYRLPIVVLGATMDGKPVSLEQSRENGELKIRLGDPDETITGSHVYEIRYATDRAITDWSDHQELYWNVNGNGWDVLTKNLSFTLEGPAMVRAAQCFTGPEGSAEHDCKVTVASSTATMVATKTLAAAEGFTVVVAFPLGTMAPLPWWRVLWYWLWEYPAIVLPFTVFVVMFLLWWTRGRDPIGRGTVIPYYEEPRHLPPALLSTLLHQQTSPKAAIATILDLARRGYVTLTPPAETEKNGLWALTRTKKVATDLLPFEQTFLKGLASPGESTTLSQEPGTYSALFYGFHKDLLKELVDRKWFVKDPGSVRGAWFIIAFLVMFVSFFAAGPLGLSFFFGGFVSAVIIAFFGWFMPKTTKEGAILSEEVEGLKLFLCVTEKERLAFHDAPAKHPEEFNRLLAVAVALGVEHAWAKQFEETMIPRPSYIQSSSSTWPALAFVQSVDHLNTSFSRSVASPSSGGSGFSSGSSGGGVGGGGGGSW